MRIFITGMTGFLGHELGQILLKKGHKLGTLARNVATSDRPIASNTESMIRGEKQSGISYYYGYSPAGFQQDDYDYQNVGIEIAVPNTPFTISGAAGFTGSEMEGGNSYSDYIATISTSAFGLDWAISYTTVDGYGSDQEIDQITWSVGASF